MKNKEEMIKVIYEKAGIRESVYTMTSYKTDWKDIYIGDVLDYIDKNLFRKETEINGMYEIDIPARERCVITLYNYFIGNYRNPIEKLDDAGIEFIYNLITNKLGKD